MNKSTRLLSLILALIISLSLLSACTEQEEKETDGNNKGTAESKTEVTTEAATEFLPDVQKQNYGEEFFLQLQPQSNKVEYYWLEESNDDVLSQAVYTRQAQIADYLGVEIVGVTVDGHDKYGAIFTTAVKNKDGSVDTLLSHSYMSLAEFISRGYLTDYNSIPEIDLDADYWNREVMDGVAAGNHLYLGYSDFRLGFTNIIVFNKAMLEKYADSMEESIYEMVTNYHWTLDSMISLANTVYVDATGDGKTVDDTFGIVGRQWENFTNFLQASNIQLVEINEQGTYRIGVNNEMNNEKTEALIGKLSELAKGNSAMFGYQNKSEKIISFTDGKTLMSVNSTLDLPGFLTTDIQFGVLPFPMYDEAQKDVGYRSLDWGGWLCVPSYMRNTEMVGNTLEMLAFYSADVQTAYYEKLLGKQVADMPDDRRMLSIIWDSICSDVGLTYSHIDSSLDYFLHMVARLTNDETSDNYASFVKSYESAANKRLKKFFDLLDK